MRSRFASTFAALVIFGGGFPPMMFDPYTPRPTHEWTFQDDTSASRGGSTPTFTRASTGSQLNYSNYLYADVASGTAQFSVSDVFTNNPGDDMLTMPVSPSRTRGLHQGETRNFIALFNTALGNAVWAETGTAVKTSSNDQTDPFGALTLDTITDDDAASAEFVSQGVTIQNDSLKTTASGWMYCASTHNVVIQLALTGGTPVTTTTTVACTTTLRKVWATATNNGTGNTTATVRLYATSTTASETGVVSWGYAQVNTNSPFPTFREEVVDTASVTVNEDDLTYSAVAHNDTGSVCLWFYAHVDDAAANNTGLFDWNGTDRFTLTTSNTRTVRLYTTGLTTNNLDLITSTQFSDFTWTHICATWNQATDSEKIYIDGAEAAYSNGTDVFDAAGVYGTTVEVGATLGRVGGDHLIAYLQYWNGTALSSQQVQRMYRRTKNLGGF